jgi:hypothetical protein
LNDVDHGGVAAFVPIEGHRVFLLSLALSFLLLFLLLFLDGEYEGGGVGTWGGTNSHANDADVVPMTRADAASILVVCF